MRSAVALAGLLLLVPVAAAAQDDGYGYRYDPAGDSGLPAFAGLRGSYAFTGRASTTVPTAPPTPLRASFNTGGGGSVYAGVRLPAGFRVELEGLYRYLHVHNVNLGNNSADTAAGGHVNLGAPMVNLLLDMPVPDFPFRPFLGGGVGGAYVDMKAADGGGNDYLRTSNWHFAYQFLAGAQIPFNESSRLTAMYRWLAVDGTSGKCAAGGPAIQTCKSNINTQSVDLGLEMDM